MSDGHARPLKMKNRRPRHMKHHPCPCPSPRKCWKPQLWLLWIIWQSVQLFFFFMFILFLYLFKLFNCTCFSGGEFSDCGHNVPYDERKVLNWKDNCHGHKWVKHNVLIITLSKSQPSYWVGCWVFQNGQNVLLQARYWKNDAEKHLGCYWGSMCSEKRSVDTGSSLGRDGIRAPFGANKTDTNTMIIVWL